MKALLKKIPPIYYLARFIHSTPREVSIWYKNKKGTERLRKASKQLPLKIVVGSSGVFDNGWTPTDIEYLNLTNSSDWARHFKENSIDAILSEHVWEHLTLKDAIIAASHCFKYIKPGGHARIAVPDGYHPKKEYIKSVDINGSGEGAYDHKVLYTHKTLQGVFEEAGFQVKLLEYFDESGKFHYNDWSVKQGTIHRTSKFDQRNTATELNYTSLIIDAIKK